MTEAAHGASLVGGMPHEFHDASLVGVAGEAQHLVAEFALVVVVALRHSPAVGALQLPVALSLTQHRYTTYISYIHETTS
jgi:hypothetical protein